MNRLFTTIIFLGLTTFNLTAQIKSPSEFLGYKLGSQFTRHHKVVDYFRYINNISAKVNVQDYGKTNEDRPLIVSFISSEENIVNLENIRENNLKKAGILEGNSTAEISIVWLSYNVHGNEASSSEAAMLTLYKLITEKQKWLQNTLVILDPCLNPDGRDRYVNWYKQTKNTPYNSNPDVSEHQEPWPGGRPNHYLFDLNRDWVWATQVETQQRLQIYNKWMPQIHVDFHEQFINSPYYFAPAAEPFHEIITDWQRKFQTEIGKNHAKYFDKNGWRYFTKESFDLLYPSYGDTYPTFMGAIGMTYEQAGHGKAGLGILTETNTVLTLNDRIEHHTTTGLSTVEIASENTTQLLNEFSKFFKNTDLEHKSYILRGDSQKLQNLFELLDKHEINYFPASERTIKVFNSKSLKPLKISNQDWVVPTNQPKGKMVKVLFEKETKLSNPITYDITAWNLANAYGVEVFASEYSFNTTNTATNPKKNKIEVVKDAYAYLCKWNEVSDAEFLGNLLQEGFNVRFSTKDFIVEDKSFKKGSLIVIRGENKHILNFDAIIVEIANRLHKPIASTKTGFVQSGADFGSSKIPLIKNKNIAVLSGEGTNSLNFGEIWHFFESQLHYPINVLHTKNLSKLNLAKYQVLILPNGYKSSEDNFKKLSSFASDGGTIIAIGSSLNNFADKEGFVLKRKKSDIKKDSLNLVPFDQREKERIQNSISGSIFKSTVDDSHPLAFGYNSNYNTLKRSAAAYNLLEKGFNVAYFSENPVQVSGFAGENALKLIPNSLLFGVEHKGNGKIIYMVDNPLIRSFWENGKLFFTNAVFLN